MNQTPEIEMTLKDGNTKPTPESAMIAVQRELTLITDGERNDIAATLQARHEGILARYIKARDEYNATETRNARFSPLIYVRALGNRHLDWDLLDKLEMVTENGSRTGRDLHAPRPDAKTIIATRAKRNADDICAAFVKKNLSKLAPIIEGKGNYSHLEVIGNNMRASNMEGRLRIFFEDGANFEVRSQGVMSFSGNGTDFVRYPTTFHDVRLPDGTLMDRPSEKKMNEVFVQDNNQQNDNLPEP